VKTVAKSLLETLKREKLVLDWREKQQARAAVRKTIARTFARPPLPLQSRAPRRKVRPRLLPHLRQLLRRRPEHLRAGGIIFLAMKKLLELSNEKIYEGTL